MSYLFTQKVVDKTIPDHFKRLVQFAGKLRRDDFFRKIFVTKIAKNSSKEFPAFFQRMSNSSSSTSLLEHETPLGPVP